MPSNQTVSLERAATDLERQRGFEASEAQQAVDNALAFSVDATRAGHDPVQLAEHLQQQAQQPEAQAQPEIQPQPVSEAPGIDPEIVDALQRSPKLRAALEQEAARVQAVQGAAIEAQQQYLQATHQAAEAAAHAFVANFPELSGISLSDLPAAMRLLQQTNPQRHAEAIQQLHRADAIGKAAIAARQQQAQVHQAQVANWIQQNDAAMDAYLAKTETPETVKAVKDNITKIAKDGRSSDKPLPAIRSLDQCHFSAFSSTQCAISWPSKLYRKSNSWLCHQFSAPEQATRFRVSTRALKVLGPRS